MLQTFLGKEKGLSAPIRSVEWAEALSYDLGTLSTAHRAVMTIFTKIVCADYFPSLCRELVLDHSSGMSPTPAALGYTFLFLYPFQTGPRMSFDE